MAKRESCDHIRAHSLLGNVVLKQSHTWLVENAALLLVRKIANKVKEQSGPQLGSSLQNQNKKVFFSKPAVDSVELKV